MADKSTTPPVVLITGCSTGIGRATAVLLGSRGWRVFASARDPSSIADLASPLVTPLRLDVTDAASRAEAVDSVLTDAGRIDALVNNAGYGYTGPLEEAPLDEVRTQFETNTFGPLALAQVVIPAMRSQHFGRIVNVSSVMGRFSIPFLGVYNGSKFALEGMSDALRMELAPWNIRVILVEPGTIRTQFSSRVKRFSQRTLENPNSPYRGRLSRAQGFLAGRPPFSGVPPENVARVIVKALSAGRPHARYQPTLDARLTLAFIPGLPDGLRDWVIGLGFG